MEDLYDIYAFVLGKGMAVETVEATNKLIRCGNLVLYSVVQGTNTFMRP